LATIFPALTSGFAAAATMIAILETKVGIEAMFFVRKATYGCESVQGFDKLTQSNMEKLRANHPV
tara:strand:- start:67 stop:261 length:195 start_codon:yes stop_codon:yes gene_type:complete